MFTINGNSVITFDAEYRVNADPAKNYFRFNLVDNVYQNGKQEAIYYQCVAFGELADRLNDRKMKRGCFLKGCSTQVVGKFVPSIYIGKDGQPKLSNTIILYDATSFPKKGADVQSAAQNAAAPAAGAAYNNNPAPAAGVAYNNNPAAYPQYGNYNAAPAGAVGYAESPEEGGFAEPVNIAPMMG